MEHGDLAATYDPSIILVLEGVLATPRWKKKRFHSVVLPPEEWEWSTLALKNIHRYTYNNVPVEVVTFHGSEVGEFAVGWLEKYHVMVRSVEAVDLDAFCESLKWRLNDIRMIVDNNPERNLRYGQKGFLIGAGGEF